MFFHLIVFLGYCVKTNPTEQDYKTNFMENGLELGQIRSAIIIIYIFKVVISVCLFVYPIITQEPLERFA